MRETRLVGVAGLVAWLMVGVPVVIQGASSASRMAGWAVAFVCFGLALALDLWRPRLVLLAVAAGAVVVMVLLLCNGFEGTLLVLVAMRLGSRLDLRRGLSWIALQTLVLGVAIAIHWSPRPAWLLAPPYLGFQVLAFVTFAAMAREVLAREKEARLNAELTALQAIVAESSRIAERLRIAHELHDAIGHHLTALTLNLEAALRRTEGEAREDVATAQTLARRVLADVRSIVADQRAEAGVDLANALQAAVAGVPRPRVHLQLDPRLHVDPERGHVLLRCTQEIVTNAARHSDAENLWIAVEREGDGYRIRARDDGRGSATPADGSGLRGMRSRVESVGGWLTIATGQGRGFDVTAFVPERSPS